METLTKQTQSVKFKELQKKRNSNWETIINNAAWWKFAMSGNYDRRFYAIYLIETYHYVQHNPKHQALVATRTDEMPIHYMKFCYEHAAEETGHEMMAYHDLINLGLNENEVNIAQPLTSTDTFIAYLYRISLTGNPFRRLGYSFWAEDSYQYIHKVMETIIKGLDLTNKHTTFLVSHAAIDEQHSQEIEEMLNKYCQHDADWDAVTEVLETSLKLQSDMLDNVVIEYQKLVNNKSDKYNFLNVLAK